MIILFIFDLFHLRLYIEINSLYQNTIDHRLKTNVCIENTKEVLLDPIMIFIC